MVTTILVYFGEEMFVQVTKDESTDKIVIGLCNPVIGMTTYNTGMKITSINKSTGTVTISGNTNAPVGGSGYAIDPMYLIIPSSQAILKAGWPAVSGISYKNHTDKYITASH